ncbi:MAG: hypothetical protein V1736_10355 [Pseudomonadota bacterium]
MSETLKECNRLGLVDIERLVYVLKSLSRAELETLEILLDEQASQTIFLSAKELDEAKGISIDAW